MAYKSLIVTMEITVVGRGHGCRFNKKHRLEKGMRRLTIKADKHHYCLACARTFLLKDIDRLQALLAEVEACRSNQNAINPVPAAS